MRKPLIRAIVLLFGVLFFNSIASARWATIDDTDIATTLYNRTIKIKKDGSYIETIEEVMEPLKESGKDRLVSMPLIYNAANSKLKVLSAKVIDAKGGEHSVNLAEIEDKPLASSPQGFDQLNQQLIAFPQITINSKIYIKHETKVKEPAVPGFFATEFTYGLHSYWKASNVQVLSELPLFIQVNDPEQVLSIKQGKQDTLYSLNIVLKKPVIKIPVNEHYTREDGKNVPWVSISTAEKWSNLGAKMTPKYEAVIQQPLPALMQNIAKEAGKEKSLFDKINKVTTRLAETITYMGDWRTIKGALVPRNLKEIAKSKIGDCKDLSAATAAILRSMKIKAVAAAVFRGEESLLSPSTLPTITNFNHAIVAVLDGEKIIWVDPTNFTSFVHGMYPDIENKKALLFDPAGSKLITTTALQPKDSVFTLVKNVTLSKDIGAASQVTGSLFFGGGFALWATAGDLMSSKENINHYLLNFITDHSRTETWHIDDYNLTSRVVSDLEFKYSFVENYSQVKTTSGQAYILSMQNTVAKLLTKSKDRVTDLLIEIPSTYRYETTLNNTVLIGNDFLNCKVESPWFTGTRDIQNTKDGIKVIDNLIFKQKLITNAELVTKEYSAMQKQAFACFGDTALVYKFK